MDFKKLFYAALMMLATHPPCIFPHSQFKCFVLIVDLVHCLNGHKLVCDHTLSLNPGVMWGQRLNLFPSARPFP